MKPALLLAVACYASCLCAAPEVTACASAQPPPPSYSHQPPPPISDQFPAADHTIYPPPPMDFSTFPPPPQNVQALPPPPDHQVAPPPPQAKAEAFVVAIESWGWRIDVWWTPLNGDAPKLEVVEWLDGWADELVESDDGTLEWMSPLESFIGTLLYPDPSACCPNAVDPPMNDFNPFQDRRDACIRYWWTTCCPQPHGAPATGPCPNFCWHQFKVVKGHPDCTGNCASMQANGKCLPVPTS